MGRVSNRGNDVNPYMVILARESRGLSQKELAVRLDVTQGRISKVEAGLLPVGEDLLANLSRVLNYPEHFFQQPGVLSGVPFTEIFHRKLNSVPKRVLDTAYAQIELRIRHLAALLRAADIPCHLPRLDIDEYGGNAAEIARLTRAALGLPRGPVKNLTQTVETAGVVVIEMDFGDRRLDAMSRWAPGLPPVFFVNQDVPTDRYRMNLAHELGHMVMHNLPSPSAEDEAWDFAQEFLMPARDIVTDLSDLTLAKLAILKPYWRVSMAGMLMRAESLNCITPNQARYLHSQMARAGYKTKEPVELAIDTEIPTLLRELIDAYRHSLGYSDTDLAYILALNDDEAWSWYLDLHESTYGARLKRVK